MKQSEYNVITNDLLASAKKIADAKRPAYTVGSEDVLANFKRVAESAEMPVGKCNLVYLLKHLDSVKSWIVNPDLHQVEPMKERYADLINYVLLNYCIMVEERDMMGELLGWTDNDANGDQGNE